MRPAGTRLRARRVEGQEDANPKSQIPSSKSQIPSSESQIPSSESQIPSSESQPDAANAITSPFDAVGLWDLGFGIRAFRGARAGTAAAEPCTPRRRRAVRSE